MRKTTIYLPEEILQAIKRQAATEACSEAALIRSALEKSFGHTLKRPKPQPGILGDSAMSTDSSHLDKLLKGFGES